jgi:hypothetical protein
MLENWFKRHQHKTSLRLHAVGIPLTLLAIPALVVGIARDSVPWCLAAAALVVVGYALQFLGHHLEGNDAGEIILIKKLLHKPYVAVVEPEKKKT